MPARERGPESRRKSRRDASGQRAGSVRWEVEDSILIIVSGRRFTTDLLAEAFRDALKTVGVSLPLKVLFDNRLSEEHADADEIRLRAELLAKHPELGPRAAVVVSDALHYGLARMGSVHASAAGLEVRVFEDYGEAMTWLKRDSSTDSRLLSNRYS